MFMGKKLDLDFKKGKPKQKIAIFNCKVLYRNILNDDYNEGLF